MDNTKDLMCGRAPEVVPQRRRGAAQLAVTIARINAALEMLQGHGESFENISQLAGTVAGICNIDRSLLLKRGKSYRQCLEHYPTLLKGGSRPRTPYNIDIDPMHPVMIRNSQLEDENIKLRAIVDDLSKKTITFDKPQKVVAKTGSAPQFKREYEVVCQLVRKILEHKPAIRIIDGVLTDLSDVSGIPRPIAGSESTAPYVKWINAREYNE